MTGSVLAGASDSAAAGGSVVQSALPAAGGSELGLVAAIVAVAAFVHVLMFKRGVPTVVVVLSGGFWIYLLPREVRRRWRP